MTNEELKTSISAIVPSATFDEGGEWLNIIVAPDQLLPLAQQLKTRPMAR